MEILLFSSQTNQTKRRVNKKSVIDHLNHNDHNSHQRKSLRNRNCHKLTIHHVPLFNHPLYKWRSVMPSRNYLNCQPALTLVKNCWSWYHRLNSNCFQKWYKIDAQRFKRSFFPTRSFKVLYWNYGPIYFFKQSMQSIRKGF